MVFFFFLNAILIQLQEFYWNPEVPILHNSKKVYLYTKAQVTWLNSDISGSGYTSCTLPTASSICLTAICAFQQNFVLPLKFKGKKLITYILFIYSVKMKYKHLIIKWQSTLISPTLPESVRIWIKAAIRIYSTMRLMLTYTAPAGGIGLLPFSLSIQCLLSLENPFFFVDKLTFHTL